MGRNFPELLVKDLKNSASMFTSRHISSGPPEPTLLAEEPEIHDDCPDMSRSDRPPSCYQLPKLKRLSAVVPNLDPATWLFEQDIEPASSTSSESSRSSFEMESIPTRPRQESVITNGAITSDRSSMSNSDASKSLVNHDRLRQKSWVDLDTDSTDSEGGKLSLEKKGSISQNARKFKKSPSLSGHGQGTRRFFALQQPRSTERGNEEQSSPKKNTTELQSSIKKTPSSVSRRTEDSAAGKGSLLSNRRASVVRTLSHIDTSLGSPNNSNNNNINNMEFPSPVWRSHQDLQQGPPIPLPPDVLETLTVCTSSFPETMLLCSSLSVETIRTYSRKIKRPDSPETSEARKLLLDGSAPIHPALPPTPPQSAGFSRWRFSSMLSPMKSTASFMSSSSGNSSSNHGEQPRYSTESNTSRTGRRSSKTQAGRGSPAPAHPDFARFKSIFPGVADYLCDALYAHIVVYNYIVLFCGPASFSPKPSRASSPRSATIADFSPAPAPRVQSSSSSSSTSTNTSTTPTTTGNSSPNKQNHKVPKKAAHVLGIARPVTTVLSSPRATDAFHAHLAEATRASLVRVSATDLEIVDVGPKKTSNGNASSPQKILRKQSRSEDDGAAEQDDHAPLRPLRDALGSCIVRLIKTMMLMSSSPSSSACCPNDDEIDIAPEGGRVGASDPVDTLLVRTLCEMVKCCEEVD
ncbi:hypothetical protein MCOR27_008309 [Pyricularia oryzae]|uniref:Uncharacterized protein n=1 Tax=Pyricularia grisea TaxID=148305 RepID=A0ABQ8NA45_PYRGI|nr:hypothetical protein MCOR26_009768 [Pyricularia oryzae]KAI6293642.1 hypothetical protein MCOR33_008984 [Pyricularia grisea]KAI6272494.1 hypothetical protein MCOR27_008309 [Pyricularia oryzae]KAI6310253.1 hypothetical protein MCOR34_006458 [Pyricularia oryzae]KAI6322449.1 hypothetical protein MCOR29_004730 [Pyricularia oryzae]